MTVNVFDLAQIDTRLKKVSHKEYAGPCPGCGGSDRFHVQPDRKEGGAWMCRNCWPAESKGWADSIEYLRQFRGMTFPAAQSFLAGKLETAIERVEQAHNRTLEKYGKPPNQTWQDRAANYAEQAQARLWTPEGQAGLDYLRSRGLLDKTIEAARLGYALYSVRLASGERRVLPCIVIPWFTDGVYWRINMLNMSRKPDEEKYYNVPGSSNAGLYMGDSLKLQRPVSMTESEIDGLSIAQEAGDLVSVVATGSTSGSRTDKWVARLALAPAVLLSQDNDASGDQGAKYWLHVLEHNAIRYRPIFHKDANAMLVADRELVRIWVAAALDYVSDQDQDTGEQEQTAIPNTITLADPETQNSIADSCSVCGTDLTDNDRACYNPDGVAFCDFNQDGDAFCSRGHVRTPIESYEQFMSIAHSLAGVFGSDCTVTSIEPGYTLDQHIAHSPEQREQRGQGKRASSNLAGIPSWLVPGSSEWEKHVDFLHLGPRLLRDFPGSTGQCATREKAIHEMKERRAAWFQQQKGD